MYMLMRGIPKDSSGNTMSTAGVYFKVADGIDSFCMTSTDIMALNNVDNVKEWFNDSNNDSAKKPVWTSNTPFAGHFDGNGVTVYGVLGQDNVSAGLFPQVSGNVSIKNVTVKNSYLYAVIAGGIIGETKDNSGTITLENCAVINSYICAKTNSSFAGAASLIGKANNYNVIANDILIYGNKYGENPAEHSYGLVSQGGGTACSFSNIISIGYPPYRVGYLANERNNSYHYLKNSIYSNVYTDQIAESYGYWSEQVNKFTYKENEIKQLSVMEMKGPNAETNMQYLAWASKGGDWYTGAIGDYPSFSEAGSMPSNTQSVYDNLKLDNYNTAGSGTQYLDDGSLGLGVYDTTLVLKTNPYMSFIFAFNDYQKNKGNGDKITVTFKSGDTVLKTVTAADDDMLNSASNGRYHKYYLRDIPITTLASGVTVEVTMDGKTYNLGTYGAEGFALEAERNYRINPCDYYKTRYDAAKALVFYAQMLDARYGEQ